MEGRKGRHTRKRKGSKEERTNEGRRGWKEGRSEHTGELEVVPLDSFSAEGKTEGRKEETEGTPERIAEVRRDGITKWRRGW